MPALGLALLIHLVVFGLVGIDLKSPIDPSPIDPSGMDVVLLAPEPLDQRMEKRSSSDASADFLSNRSQAAGTNAPTAPLTAAERARPAAEASEATMLEPLDEPSNVEGESRTDRRQPLDLTGLMDSQDQTDWSNPARPLQSNPKHKFIHASTREHIYAAYMDAWVKKIERVGKLHYPQWARRQGVSGELVLSVELLASGEVADIRVERSSGKPLLDKAALDIVSLGAPYAPLPVNDEDIERLTITRTWQFSSGGAFR